MTQQLSGKQAMVMAMNDLEDLKAGAL